MEMKFLITGGIAVVVFSVANIVLALPSWIGLDILEWLGLSLYVTAFYAAPTAFVVAVIGYIVCVVKARSEK
jgi:hypothetical protein